MRVLGIDPGLQRTGWGVIDFTGNRLSFVAAGVVSSKASDALCERLGQIHAGLNKVILLYKPDTSAIEETFVTANGVSTLKLGQARGAALLTCALAGLPVSEYAATQVKKTVVGVGRAEKRQVILMVQQLLPGSAIEQPDAADALAIAICHASQAAFRQLSHLSPA